jgi:hypothetical protein
MTFDPATTEMLVREKTNDFLREAAADRLADLARGERPRRSTPRLRLPFSLRLSLPLLRERRNVTL